MLNFNILRIPLIPSSINQAIFLKPENLQAFGSYKIRGIAKVIATIPREKLQLGLCAASAGNMAQAVAFAAKQLQIPCQIFIPNTAPQNKKDKIQQLGAKLIPLDFAEVWSLVRENNYVGEDFFIHPVFCEPLLLGYETIADEIIADLPHADAVVIPFGVGGLSLAVARKLKQLSPTILIYTCEPETAAPLAVSLRAQRAITINRTPSFVDAIGTPEVLPKVYELLSPLIEDSIVVSIADIKAALSELLQHHSLLVEGAGASALAAAKSLTNRHQKIVAILTGGNIDLDLLKTMI